MLHRRTSISTALGLLASVFLSWSGDSAAKSTTSPKTDIIADSWRAPTMRKDEFVGFMRVSFESALKELPQEKAARLRATLGRLEKRPVAERVSYGTYMSSMLEALGFGYEARAYAKWTVLQSPNNPVAVANESALTCYPPTLRLATEVASGSPVVYTNLGSCAMTAHQWEIAKTAYEHALKLDPNHRNALIGLGRWYFRVRDLDRAFEYFVKAKGVHLERDYEKRDAKGKVFPPPQLLEPEYNRFGVGSPTARVTNAKMQLPPLPSWKTQNAFLVSGKKRKALGDYYGRKVGQFLRDSAKLIESRPLDKIRKQRQELEAMTQAQRDELAIRQALTLTWDDTAILRAIDLNNAWAAKRLAEADAEFTRSLEREKSINQQFNDVLKTRQALQNGGCRNTGASGGKECLERTRDAALTTCKAAMPLAYQSFALWRDAYQKWYQTVRPVLEELYRVQGLWIRQIASPTLWQMQVKARDVMVFSPLSSKMTEEKFRRLSITTKYAGAFASPDGRCPNEPPPKMEDAEEPTLPETSEPASDCPIPPGKPWNIPPFSLPGLELPFSAKLSCTEVEVALKAGYSSGDIAEAAGVLSVTHRFGTDQSTTVFVGVQGNLNFGVPVATVGVGAEAGTAFTFDKQGQLQDYGLRVGVNENASLPLNLATVTAGTTAAIEKSAPASITSSGESGGLFDPFSR
jgi:tetratricopeptide (TPR) repeat protein